jgi:hypothetical protein
MKGRDKSSLISASQIIGKGKILNIPFCYILKSYFFFSSIKFLDSNNSTAFVTLSLALFITRK